jgi:caffeoyl-CoA O-methyltransferase
MEIINEKASAYIEKNTSSFNGLLQQIIEETNASHTHAHMLSGSVQGKFLQIISSMVKPLKVLEIGTFTGFSALCLASGLQPNGILHSIEIREEDAIVAQNNFNKSEYAAQIKLHIGNAKEIIPNLNEKWDLIFIDADKTSYIEYYELTLPQLHQGAFMLVDNVLFHGQVLEESISGKNAKSIYAFNEHIAKDDRTEQVMLSIRDGITLIKKL